MGLLHGDDGWGCCMGGVSCCKEGGDGACEGGLLQGLGLMHGKDVRGGASTRGLFRIPREGLGTELRKLSHFGM